MTAALGYRQEIGAIKDYVESLHDRKSRNICAIDKLKSEIDSFNDDRELINKLCGEITSAQTQRSTFKQLLEELHNSADIVTGLHSHQQDCNVELDYGASRQKALFEKFFGLKFKLTEDKAITFEFCQLTPTNLDKSCSITLDVNSKGEWEVVQMEPPISGVQALLNQLNQTGNLKNFCKQLRLKFKKHE